MAKWKASNSNQTALFEVMITQQNALSRSIQDINATGKDFLYFMQSIVNPLDTDYENYTDYYVPIREIELALGITSNNRPQLIDKLYALKQNVIIIKQNDLEELPLSRGDWIMTSPVGDIVFNDATQVLKVPISPNFKPFLIRLQKDFNTFRLTDALSLTGNKIKGLFDLICSWKNAPEFTLSIDELYLKLGMIPAIVEEHKLILTGGKKKYPVYSNFKQRVLHAAWKQITSKTSVYYDYAEIYKKDKVVAIKFSFPNNTIQDKIEVDEDKTDLYPPLIRMGVTDTTARLVLNNSTRVEIKYAYQLTKTAYQDGKIIKKRLSLTGNPIPDTAAFFISKIKKINPKLNTIFKTSQPAKYKL